MARFAVGGLLHETNTFSPRLTVLNDFLQADYWPALQHGQELLENLDGLNTSISGAIDVLAGAGHTLVPLTWASAPPGGLVVTSAFEDIVARLIDDLQRARPIHGVYLELHGAMAAQHTPDGDGEVLRRVRAVVGDDVPVVASLDLHANVSEDMIRYADLLEAYRTYPHVDINDTGRRAAERLLLLASGRGATAKAFRRIEFLIPGPWQCTDIEPAKSLYELLRHLSPQPAGTLSFAQGFNSADVACAGPSVFGYATDQPTAGRIVETLAHAIAARETDFAGPVYSARDAVAHAIRLSGSADGPVVIADAEDNPGGGAPSDTTAILMELIAQKAQGAVVAIVRDPAAALAAHDAGIGSTITIPLGGSLDGKPLRESFYVEALGSGNFTATGPMWGGSPMELGRMALLRIAGIRIIVSSKPFQAADQAAFRHLGVEPAQQKILSLKSMVHFRNDFEAMSSEILVAAAGGALPIDARLQKFHHLRSDLRLTPRSPER